MTEQDTLHRLHSASMAILEETGIRILDPDILERVKKNGVTLSGNMAFFTEKQVMTWVEKAPSRFTLHARNPSHSMEIGGTATWYAAGYGCPAIIEADGTRRPARFQDYLRLVKLVHACDCFHLNGGILVQPSDLDTASCFQAMLSAVIQHSDKCLMGFPGRRSDVQTLMEIASSAAGGWNAFCKAPWIITLANTTSPLQLDGTLLSTLEVCARHRQPVIISPGPIAGATGPITPAGNVALGNAEILAAVAISQMIRQGTPVVYGLEALTCNMFTGGIAIGSPGFGLQAAWGARLAKMYGLPSRGGGAPTDASGVCAQSGYESMFNLMVSRQAGLNLILHSAGILDAFGALSFEQFLVDVEIIRMVEYYHAGLAVDDDALALSEIQAAGPGGQFLTAAHTLKNCRSVPWLPMISLRGSRKGNHAHTALMTQIEKKLADLEATYRQPQLPDALHEKIKPFTF